MDKNKIIIIALIVIIAALLVGLAAIMPNMSKKEANSKTQSKRYKEPRKPTDTTSHTTTTT